MVSRWERLAWGLALLGTIAGTGGWVSWHFEAQARRLEALMQATLHAQTAHDKELQRLMMLMKLPLEDYP